jgi:hypothetical protein
MRKAGPACVGIDWGRGGDHLGSGWLGEPKSRRGASASEGAPAPIVTPPVVARSLACVASARGAVAIDFTGSGQPAKRMR